MQLINHIQVWIVFIVFVTVLYKSAPAIRKTVKRQDGKFTFIPPEIKGSSTSRLLDLSFIFLACALYSVLLFDAFIIRKEISQGIAILSISALITILLAFFLLFTWYIGKGYLGVGAGALATLLMLPIRPEGQDFFWLPVIILVFLSSTAWIYELGFSLHIQIQRNNKKILLIVLALALLIATLKLGFQFQYNLLNHEATPSRFKVEKDSKNAYKIAHNKDARGVQDKVFVEQDFKQGNTIEERHLLYSLLSDIHLINFYRDNHINFLDDKINFLKEESNSLSESEENSLAFRERRFRFHERRFRFAQEIASDFQELDLKEKIDYLRKRLQWVHPIAERDFSSPISLPGKEAEERINNLADSRICNALLDIKNERSIEEYDAIFNYVDSSLPISYIIQREDFNPFSIDIQRTISSRKGNECILPREVFPKSNSDHLDKTLKRQLLLPTEYETHLTFLEYKLLATEYLEDKDVVSFIEKFESSLKSQPQSRGAFINYFAGDGNEEHLDIFRRLIDSGLTFEATEAASSKNEERESRNQSNETDLDAGK